MIKEILLRISVTDKDGNVLDIVDALESTGFSLNRVVRDLVTTGGIGTDYSVNEKGDPLFWDDPEVAYCFRLDEAA